MRSSAWVAGVLMAVSSVGMAAAADYSGSYHEHRARGPRGAIGQCVRTRVATIGPIGAPDGPPGIVYRDGVVQDYDSGELGQAETHPGDPIQLCLVSFTRDCGSADLPGRTYATGNLRTGAAWTQPDIRSSCSAPR